uniref:Thrombospondin type 1 domain containing 1 n=1 Tax=Salvator merianae TaxID=96440 RepID=A0A8D0BEF1_SALMN
MPRSRGSFAATCCFPSRVRGCLERATQSVPITLVYPEEEQRASSNLVTVSGISVCLSIIFATILITVWRKLCRSQKCVGTPLPCDPTHSPSFRKNSDEENICQETQHRESFSEGEAQCSPSGDPDIPLRRSFHFAQDEGGALANESFQSSAQKIIPPIFSYRLAQQQLKEMKKKGLTETTKVYHVSQNPLTDTVLSTSVGSEKQEGATANTFRIKSPFLEPLPGYPKLSRDKPCSRMDFSLSQAVPSFSPTQSLTRRGQSRYPENLGEPFERCYSRNSQFRRTASFHETKKPKPFRKRCMSALTPSQTPLYHTRARTWDRAPEDHLWPKSKSTYWNSEELELHYNPSSTVESVTCAVPNPPKWEAPGKKPDLVSRHQPAQTLCADKADQKRNRKGPFLNHMGAWRNEAAARTFKDGPQRGDALSPTQFRRSKCQSFPSNPEYHFYDNTSFGMAELEQQMTDLPGYFGSNEGEISSLSIDNLVL